jgi:CheY-like chemotaxis protein
MTTKSAVLSNATETRSAQMPKLLVVDDDAAVRGMLRTRLSDSYEVVETDDPEQAVALALEHKPDAILLDLMMPKFSGFELCQGFHSLSYTALIPIFVISGEGAGQYKEQCQHLGAKGFFQKPVDFAQLKAAIAAELQGKRPERRAHVRVGMRVPLILRGVDGAGKAFEETTTTENVSSEGFLCNCSAPLIKGTIVEVYLPSGDKERLAGKAEVVRRESSGSPWQRYGFHFLHTTKDWVLHE